MPDFRLAGRTAVITGAGSGIGRALAQVLAARGCHLALADIDAHGLAETRRSIAAEVRVSEHVMDVADRQAVAALPEAVRAAHDGVDLLVNNAGVAVGGTFDQVTEDDFEWLFGINFWGVVRMTRAFLPRLREREAACIVNISSIFGIVAPAEQVAYSASKFAVRGFSEALRHELAGSNVHLMVVHPGGVRTNIGARARAPRDADPHEVERRRAEAEKLLRMPPPIAAARIVRAIEQRRGRLLVGVDAKGLALLARLAPESYWTVLAKGLGR